MNNNESNEKGGVKKEAKKQGLLERLFGIKMRVPEATPEKLKKAAVDEEANEIEKADREINAELLKSVEGAVRDLDSRLGRLEKKEHKSIIASLKRKDKHIGAVTNLEHRVKKTEVRIARCEIALKKMQQKRGD